MKKLCMIIMLMTIFLSGCNQKKPDSNVPMAATEVESEALQEFVEEVETESESCDEEQQEESDEDAEETEDEEETLPNLTAGEKMYIRSDVQMRKTPDLDGEVVSNLEENAEVERISEDGNWSCIVYEQKIGYVRNEFLRVKDEDADVDAADEVAANEEDTITGQNAVAEKPVSKTDNGKVICIDAGHQSKANNDQEPVGPGASTKKKKVSSGTAGKYTKVPEYKLNLAVALKLQKELESRGYTVIMCRTTNDVNISNRERADMANDAKADAFIRIHADGASQGDPKGTMTICQTKNNPYNAKIYTQCKKLSQCVVDAICDQTGSRNKGVWETDTMSGINWSKVPVTIVEMGYMTNKEEDEAMQTESYQNKIVTGIANGLDDFFG